MSLFEELLSKYQKNKKFNFKFNLEDESNIDVSEEDRLKIDVARLMLKQKNIDIYSINEQTGIDVESIKLLHRATSSR